jgi:glycosyltransferase involved in cell wall biosynthesis
VGLVSIIIPVRNEELYLSECITSIQHQLYHDWELIIVDDHSTDHTKQIASAAAKQDPRIIYHASMKEGITPALTAGLKRSKGQFITRMDGDDLMPVDKLARMVELLKAQGQKSVVTGLVKYFPEQQISKGYQQYERWLNTVQQEQTHYREIYRECMVASANWMMYLETFLSIGGFDGLAYPEDYAMTFRWFDHHLSIVSLPIVTHLWRDHPARTSKISSDYAQEAFFELKIKHFVKTHDLSRSLVVWGNNKKSKITTKLLSDFGYTFHQMVLEDNTGLDHYREVEKLKRPLVLITVYPDQKHKEQINNYLAKINLAEGKDYWYL